MPLRLGIVGSGHSLAYAAAAQRVDDVSLVALCALPDDPRRADAVKKYGIKNVYDDVEKMLAYEGLDLVVVGSPPNLHRAHTCAALEAGAHVLCEKPPATCAADAEACYFRALAVDRHLEWGFCLRQSKNLPPPRPHLSHVHASWQRSTGPGAPWARDVQVAGGGVLADLGPHAVDCALYALGEPTVERVRGLMYDAAGGIIASDGANGVAEDRFIGVLDVSGGRRITLDVSWCAQIDEAKLVCYGDAPHAPPHTGKVEDTSVVGVDDLLFERTLRQFIQHCYASNRARQLELSGQGVALMRLLDALYTSARTGGQPPIALS